MAESGRFMNSTSKQPPQTPSNPQWTPLPISLRIPHFLYRHLRILSVTSIHSETLWTLLPINLRVPHVLQASIHFEIRYLLREEILLKVKRLYVQKLRDRELLRFQVYLKLWNLLWACLKKNFGYARQLPKPSLQTSLPHIFALLSAGMKMQWQPHLTDQYAVLAHFG